MKKKMTPEEKQKEVEAASHPASQEYEEQLANTLEQLQAEVASLKSQLQALNRKSSSRIGVVFAVPGVWALILSIVTNSQNSQVLAFIGLGLTFWGALFFLVRPITYVRGSLLGITVVTLYSTVDRILKSLDYKGKALYIPPYPREVYLPEHLRGLKETIVFISADINSTLPSIEEIAGSKFMTNNPKGICLAAPGSSLLDQFELILRTDLAKMSLEDLCGSLPQLILENFQLAKEIEMKTENQQVRLKMSDSVYRNLYREEYLRSVRLLGCPLASAVACAIAKTTGKATYIESIDTSLNAQTVEVSYRLTEG